MDLHRIANSLGFKATRPRREWRGDCPSCGYRAAACLTTARDGAPILLCAACSDMRELRRILRDAAGGAVPHRVTVRQAEQVRDIGARIRRARDLWDGSIPITGTLAEVYLSKRQVFEALSAHQHHQHEPALRFAPECWNTEAEKKLPALLAACRVPLTGELRATHRTYLDPQGGKASVTTPKKVIGPWNGCVVMLHDAPAFGPLVVAEGTETSARST